MVEKLRHQLSHRYLEMRQECRTFKSVASGPCDWLLLILAMRARGTPSTKNDGKIDEWQDIWGWDEKNSNMSLLGR